MKTIILCISSILLISSCSRKDENKPVGADGWLKGDENQKFGIIAN